MMAGKVKNLRQKFISVAVGGVVCVLVGVLSKQWDWAVGGGVFAGACAAGIQKLPSIDQFMEEGPRSFFNK